MKGCLIGIGVLGLGIVGAVLLDRPAPVRRATGPLPNDVYVWQRAWTGPVQEAIEQHAGAFSELVVLSAEVVGGGRSARVVRVPVDYAALRQANRPVGLALRISQFPGPFVASDERTRGLCRLAVELIQEATTNQVRVVELQIDFDCATSKLEGYGVWVKAIRQEIAPMPVVITVLPAW
jgi:hypothetical protein